MPNKTYRCIGVMTGNSLDAVDVVLTEFSNQNMKDICGLSLPISTSLSNRFRHLKFMLSQNGGDIEAYVSQSGNKFYELHDEYIKLVAQAINKLLSENKIAPNTIDAIGFHGQTCAHCPPSIAQSRDKSKIYTLQIGSGQMLANLTNIPVVYDFRSDDIMNLGEGAPLAPTHNHHITQNLIAQNIFPAAFCNGGNTGNISIISKNKITGQDIVMGWDVGPFNHFIDMLMRNEKNMECDFNGETGKSGKINYRLLRQLFENAVQTNINENFITMLPPKSSDPAWYIAIPMLTENAIAFEDRIRTAEFFSAYIMVYNLSFISHNIEMPKYFLFFGGGWKNPLIMEDFKNILSNKASVLPEHQHIFNQVINPMAVCKWSDDYGYSGKYMEARIFADMAKCYLTQEPFTFPETTGCQEPTIGGIMAYPNGKETRLWSRAAKGWAERY